MREENSAIYLDKEMIPDKKISWDKEGISVMTSNGKVITTLSSTTSGQGITISSGRGISRTYYPTHSLTNISTITRTT